MIGEQLEVASTYPVHVVPVYYFHSFEQPFCSNPQCQCQVNRQTTVQLFRQIIEGKLELEQAARFAERTVC